VICLLELAFMPGGSAGESAFLVTKELRLNQLCRNSRAVHRDKRSVAPRTLFVDRARYQLLTGSRLAQYADTRLACRHPFELCHQAGHLLAAINQLVFAQLPAKLLVLILELGKL